MIYNERRESPFWVYGITEGGDSFIVNLHLFFFLPFCLSFSPIAAIQTTVCRCFGLLECRSTFASLLENIKT